MSLDVYLSTPACPTCGHSEEVFWANITHNLGEMAQAAGVYQACWHPEEIGATRAADIIPALENGFRALKNNPERFRRFDSPNDWGRYEHFVRFVKKYLHACQRNPNAEIRISR